MFPKDALLSIHAHIRAHLGIQKNLHGIHPLGVYTFFFSKSFCVLIDGTFLFQKKNWQSLLSKNVLAF